VKIVRRGKEWWIVGVESDVPECGPYQTRAEASADKRGLERFERYGGSAEFVIGDGAHSTCGSSESGVGSR